MRASLPIAFSVYTAAFTAVAAPLPEQVLAPQLAPAAGMGLTGETLLGRYGLSASDVLAEVAPHLKDCVPKLSKAQASGQVVHEYYDLYFGDYPLFGAVLHLHHVGNQLAMIRAALPDYRLPAEPFTASDFLPLATFGITDPGVKTRAVLAESAGFPAPAWEVTRVSPDTGRPEQVVIDAQTGAQLSQTDLVFDLAQVYAKGPADGVLVTVDLPDLPGTGYLDGKHFAVYAPDVGDPRVQAPDNVFDFRPDDPAEALEFDQVESYYGATRALTWFQQKFGYDLGDTQITVRVNDLVNGNPANAQFLPPPLGPEIQIGKGDDTLHNLARDTAVISHEFSHQIIYEHVKVHEGEAAIYHEGTADYFAYAINEDPCLGHSIVVAGGCLRTAAIDPSMKFDAADQTSDPHLLGQYWSAVLWDLRGALGEDAGDKLVYDSLAYMGPTSGLRDAFLALLEADRDQFPLPAGAPEQGTYGAHKCMILDTGVTRGFAEFLGEFSGASCGLNLGDLAQLSRDTAAGLKPRPPGKAQAFTMFGRTCSVVGGLALTTGWWAWLLLIPPLLAWARGGRAWNRRREDGP